MWVQQGKLGEIRLLTGLIFGKLPAEVSGWISASCLCSKSTPRKVKFMQRHLGEGKPNSFKERDSVINYILDFGMIAFAVIAFFFVWDSKN